MINYEAIYNKTYNHESDFFSFIIKTDYEKYKKQNRPFAYATKETMANYNEFTSVYKVEKVFVELFEIYNNRHKLYDSNHLQLVFENDLKKKFEGVDLTDTGCKNFEDFIATVALFDSFKNVEYNHGLNIRLIELFYLANDFEKFEIKKYDCILELVPIFIELRNKVYPNHQEDQIEYELFENFESFESDKLNESSFITKKTSLPEAIAMLQEVGFFNLDEIKKLSDKQKYNVVSIITGNSNVRSIKGNINVLKTHSKEDNIRYTSNLHLEEMRKLLKEIK